MKILTEDAPQTARLLAHLEESGSISWSEAQTVHGITRLAARIFELRQAGHEIRSEDRADEAGQRYVRYYLLSR